MLMPQECHSKLHFQVPEQDKTTENKANLGLVHRQVIITAHAQSIS